MACPSRPVTALTVYLVYLLALFGSYCQMAPAVAGATRGWDVGGGLKYQLTTTVLFREAEPSTDLGGEVGFQLTGQVDVTAVWRDPSDQDSYLLRLQLLSPQLWIKSRKAPEPEGFVEHSSRADELAYKPVLALWRHGEINSIYLDVSETVSSSNVKRGLVSLFQYRTLDDEVREKDASGLCHIVYASLGPQTVSKRKISCEQNSLPPAKCHPNPIFGITESHLRNATYELTHSLLPKSIREEEKHAMGLTISPEVGSLVITERTLELVPGTLTGKTVEANSVRDAVAALHVEFKEVDMEQELEPVTCPENGCPTLEQTIADYRDVLDTSALGTAKSATAFIKLIPLVKAASSEELLKLLKSPRYRQLKTQLLDLYGTASTLAAHQAAMKVLKQDEVGDDTERYLWASSLSPSPHEDIVKYILKRSEETMQNDKVSESMALSAAAMARHRGLPSAIEKARISLELGLESCTGDECKLKFIRALRNLRSKEAIPTLLNYALSENKSISVAAWKALAMYPREHVTAEVKKAAIKTFYQLGGPRRDSSSRTLALDVLLGSDPTNDDLKELVEYLSGDDPAYEVRKYASQRLEQLSEKRKDFARNVKETFKSFDDRINNYNVLAQKGLSTAFARNFMKSNSGNGSLVTVQEVSSGLLKRGIVDVVLEPRGHEQVIFSLGLFVGGLNSFVSSSNSEEDGQVEDEQPATAGMEIDVLGVGVRPFVFFSGQGELMGHVWSGTASERTPAFQALVNLHSYSKYVPLGVGVVAEQEVQGAMSFDLAGQIQLSLWSRNAQSLVEMGAGIAIHGGTKVRSNFVQSMADFSMTLEPKLELASDVDFAGPVSLCMRLSQPETTIKHHIYKIERIPGSRHRLRKTRRTKLHSPGKSYLLNRKNNEMCSKVFS